MSTSKAGVDTLSRIETAREATLLAELPEDLAALVMRSRQDPGAPFEPAALERLTRLRAEEPSTWARVRVQFKLARGVLISDLERLMGSKSSESDDRLQGQALAWEVPERWPEPVDGAALLTEIADFIPRYVSIERALADTLALWAVMTWIHERLVISTFLNVTSATKRCGKSLLLEVLSELVYRPLPVGGRVTSAALFRTVEMYAPTLLLDEADTFFKDDEELKGVVNSSQRRATAFMLRCVGDEHEPRRFGTWCPKAIGGIGGLPDTVLDRSIVVRLERRAKNVSLARWRERDGGATEELRRRLSRWADDEQANIVARLSVVTFPHGLNDRARDAWESLLAIGDVAGGEWPGPDGRALAACTHVAVSGAGEEDGAREMLLADLLDVFEAKNWPETLTSEEVAESLIMIADRPWGEWRRGKALTTRGLSTLLKPFGVQPRTKKAVWRKP